MKHFLALCLTLFAVETFSQQAYFQQEVNYDIDVTLYDQSHILRGREEIEYINNSKDTLRFILVHLWPNAYKNDKAKFTEHAVEGGDTKFYFSKKHQRGFIDSLSFMVDNESVSISEFNNQPDIVVLELNKPLAPRQKINISTPFRVVLPEVFSRMGHDKQTYQISQWYPKPAVYDMNGWHPMSYIDQGEFYSEFGSFDVRITTPDNYVVAATGVLQTENENSFLTSRIVKDTIKKPSKLLIKDTIPNSSTQWKTVRFKQDRVHDFAWFADKSYLIDTATAILPSGKKVDCYSYYKPRNAHKYRGSAKYIKYSLEYLSKHVGEYPYAHASVVDGKLEAGGGMEYPMITVIGSIPASYLGVVIAHEVGHNWFQGILASNERQYPWMDEGINSFYEEKIMNYIDSLENKKKKDISYEEHRFSHWLTARMHNDQAINSSAEELTHLNLGCIVYKKTPMMLAYLEDYLGKSTFERAMKAYFDEWKFKHPYPEDFQQIVTRTSNKNLDWFFKQGLNSDEKIDFKIKPVIQGENTSVQVASRTAFKGPIPVSHILKDSVIQTHWIEYPYKEAKTFNGLTAESQLKINAHDYVPEQNYTNNHYKNKGLFRRFACKPGIGSSFKVNEAHRVFVLPALGYNHYDKFMLGGVIHNIQVPNHPFQFAIAPMFAFGSKAPVGTGFITNTFFTKDKTVKSIELGIRGNSFHHASSSLNIATPLHARHLKIAPHAIINFREAKARSTVQRSLELTYFYIQNQNFTYERNPIDSLFRPSLQSYIQHYGRIQYRHINSRVINPFSYHVDAVAHKDFIKIGLTANARIDYHMKNKGLHVRAFAGKYFNLNNENTFSFSQRNTYLNATYTGQNDFLYEEVYFGRNEQKGLWAQQVSMQEGGLKIPTPFYANPLGVSDNWLAAVNLRSDIPAKLPIKIQLFYDVATFAQAGKQNPSGNKVLFDGGVAFNLFKEVLVINVPLVLSKDYNDYLRSAHSKGRFFKTISFSLDFKKIPLKNTQSLLVSI